MCAAGLPGIHGVFLSNEGRVHEGSLNPYLAAVNQMHEDSGLEKPGTTHFVRLARRGFAAIEAEGSYRPAARVPVPAPVMLEILQLGLKTLPGCKHLIQGATPLRGD